MKRGYVRLEKTSSELIKHVYYRISTDDIPMMPLENLDVLWPEDAADAITLILKVLGIDPQGFSWDSICDVACKLAIGEHVDFVTDSTIYKDEEVY